MRPGDGVGDYTIVEKIAEGGQSLVYLATDGEGKQVIIKQLKDLHRDDPQLVERFLRDGEIHRTLRHPHVARVFDCLERDGRYFMVQEYLSGGSLASVIDGGEPYLEREVIGWCRDALRALNYVHENGVVHRDVKASNLMLDHRRRVKLIDFGIARVFGEDRITRVGDGALGTPWYMSPEQILEPDKIDHQTDVYSMGIVLYELLTGRVPFNGNTPPQVHLNIITRNPPPRIKRFSDCVTPINPDATGIDPELEKIILRAIEKDKRRRFGGCAEFEIRLRHYTDGQRHWWQRLKDSLWQFLGALWALVSRKAVIGSLFLILLLVIAALIPPPIPVYGLHLVKSVDPATVSTPGTVVTYRYAVTNTGNVEMRNVNVFDEGVTLIPRSGDDGDGALDPGETWVYEAKVLIDQSHFDAGGVLVSTAVASSGGVKANHKAGVTLIVRREMKMSTLVNGAKSATLTPPGPVTYTYNVSNVGNARLTGVRMTDKPPMKPRFLGGDTNQNKVLDPGESWQYDATVQITEALLKGADTFVSRAVAVSDQVTSQPDMATVTISRPPSSP